MPAGNTGDTGEHCSWGRGHPAPYPPTAPPGTQGPCAVPPPRPSHSPTPGGGRCLTHLVLVGQVVGVQRLGRQQPPARRDSGARLPGAPGGGASKSHHLAQFWGQGDIPVLPGALLPTPYRGQPGMGTGALMGPCCAPHAPSPGKGIPTRTCPPPAGSSSPRA